MLLLLMFFVVDDDAVDVFIVIIITIIIIILFAPLRRVFTIIYLKQTTFLGYIVLQLFCSYNLCYMYCSLPLKCVLYFYISTFCSMCAVSNMAVFCIY